MWSFKRASTLLYAVCVLSLLRLTSGTPSSTNGTSTAPSIVVDGDFSDWTAADRLDVQSSQTSTLAGVEFYARIGTPNTYYFALIMPENMFLITNTRLYLNTDNDFTTGFQVDQTGGRSNTRVGGADFYVQVEVDNSLSLYSGRQVLIKTLAQFTYGSGNTDATRVEFAVPFSDVGNPTGPICLLLNIATVGPLTVRLPPAFAAGWGMWLSNEMLPLAAPSRTEERVAVVYSTTSAAQFSSLRSYTQLFQTIQHETMMAGVPFDLVTLESQLTSVGSLMKYNAIVLGYAAAVPTALRHTVGTVLSNLAFRYGVGLIAAGNLLTTNEFNSSFTDNPYGWMGQLLALQPQSFTNGVNFTVYAASPVAGYAVNELIETFPNGSKALYAPATAIGAGVVAPAGLQRVPIVIYDDIANSSAVLRLQFANTVIPVVHYHFAIVNVLADRHLLWDILRSVVFFNKPGYAALLISRQQGILTWRCDADISMYVDQASSIEPQMRAVYQKWVTDYGFAGSVYINIGNNTAQGLQTQWFVMKTIYNGFIADGHEIGTHSYTHPQSVDQLTPPGSLSFEFLLSQQVIQQNLGNTVYGAAIPGDPESLDPTDVYLSSSNALSYVSGVYSSPAGAPVLTSELAADRSNLVVQTQWIPYLSGSFGGAGSGSLTAFGWLWPPSVHNYQMIYLNLGMMPDYTLLNWYGLSIAESLDTWSAQLDLCASHSPCPIVHYMAHDYYIANASMTAYFTGVVQQAWQRDLEFVTGQVTVQRWRSFHASHLTQTWLDANRIQVTVSPPSADIGMAPSTAVGSVMNEMGTGCLEMSAPILAVDGWYAWNASKLFLPSAGGSFVVTLRTEGGASVAVADTTHITRLPQRARLVSLVGDGRSLTFSVTGGYGQVGLHSACAVAPTISSTPAGITVVSGTGSEWTYNLPRPNLSWTVSVTCPSTSSSPTAAPSMGPSSMPSQQPTTLPTLQPTMPGATPFPTVPTTAPSHATAAPTRLGTLAPTSSLPQPLGSTSPTHAPVTTPTAVPTRNDKGVSHANRHLSSIGTIALTVCLCCLAWVVG